MDDGIELERWIDLPRVIVWDALIDPVLVEGWLHPTARLLDGKLLDRVDPALLAVRSEEFGEVRIELVEHEGGTRGTTTELRATILSTADPRFRAPIAASWRLRLDQLENLLRGHPVDWAHWQRDSGPTYDSYLAREQRAR